MEDQLWIERKKEKKNEVKGGVDAPKFRAIISVAGQQKNKRIGHSASFVIDNNFRSEKKLKDKSGGRE